MLNPWKRLEEQNAKLVKPIKHSPSNNLDEEWERRLNELTNTPYGTDPFYSKEEPEIEKDGE